MEFSIGSVPGRPVRRLPVRTPTRQAGRPLIRGRLLSDVFDVFTAGVLIVGSDRRPLTWNPAVIELLGPAVESARSCCDLFGCHRAGTPLADACLTELALARGSHLPEIVLDAETRPGARIGVTATAFGAGPGQTVLFEIRAARSEPAVVSASQPVGGTIYIQTFGETAVRTPSGETRGGWLDQRPGRLLKLLVAHRYTPLHGDVIGEALWPKTRADTTNTVRHFVHALREKLEPDRVRYQPSEFILARNGGYLINPERVTVDADEFEREVKQGLRAFGDSDREAAIGHLRRALDLYHGDFLAEERFEDWAIVERERLRDLATKPLRMLAALTDDREEAAAYLERLAEMEPLDVEIHRELLRAWMQQGRRGRAMRHYRALQSRLMRELGERVTFDLADLAHSPLAH